VAAAHDIRIPVALAPDGQFLQVGRQVTGLGEAAEVRLVAGRPPAAIVNGELCSTNSERHFGQMVQLLIAGATYTHGYWDFGTVDSISYSYARAVAAHGQATFAIDPLGQGDSTRLSSGLITAQTDAFVDHQVVDALRDGKVGGIRFAHVIAVGHSLNSLIVWDEAIAYHDVDGVIVTGAAHSLGTAFATSGDLYPASQDPKFAASGLDPGYLTTRPGTRQFLFYHLPDADPAVIAQDEARKDVVSGAELNTALPVLASTATQAIHVPVLDILGSNDLTTCGPNTQGGTFDCSSAAAVVAQETPYYSPQAQLQACVIPGSGHDISLALNHNLQVADTVAWTHAFVEHTASPKLPRNCR
jgi:pimeloyl-ACP methyl ester carboxylesterase